MNEYGLYAADDWRMTGKLTLELWPCAGTISALRLNESNQWSNFNPNTGKMDVAGRNGVSRTADVHAVPERLGASRWLCLSGVAEYRAFAEGLVFSTTHRVVKHSICVLREIFHSV